MGKLENSMRVLRLFSTSSRQLSVSKVAEALDLPKSSISRLMREMQSYDLVEQDSATRMYRPGHFLFQLGMIYENHLELFDLVSNRVRSLVEKTGYTAYIGKLDGGDFIALRTIQGHHPIRYVVEAGQRIPAYAISCGQCLLSRLEDSKIRQLYGEALEATYLNAPKTIDTLLRSVAEIRRSGLAEVDVSSLPGVRAVGVAVASGNQKEAYGYSLSFPNGQLSKAELASVRQDILESAIGLGEQIGDRFFRSLAQTLDME